MACCLCECINNAIKWAHLRTSHITAICLPVNLEDVCGGGVTASQGTPSETNDDLSAATSAEKSSRKWRSPRIRHQSGPRGCRVFYPDQLSDVPGGDTVLRFFPEGGVQPRSERKEMASHPY